MFFESSAMEYGKKDKRSLFPRVVPSLCDIAAKKYVPSLIDNAGDLYGKKLPVPDELYPCLAYHVFSAYYGLNSGQRYGLLTRKDFVLTDGIITKAPTEHDVAQGYVTNKKRYARALKVDEIHCSKDCKKVLVVYGDNNHRLYDEERQMPSIKIAENLDECEKNSLIPLQHAKKFQDARRVKFSDQFLEYCLDDRSHPIIRILSTFDGSLSCIVPGSENDWKEFKNKLSGDAAAHLCYDFLTSEDGKSVSMVVIDKKTKRTQIRRLRRLEETEIWQEELIYPRLAFIPPNTASIGLLHATDNYLSYEIERYKYFTVGDFGGFHLLDKVFQLRSGRAFISGYSDEEYKFREPAVQTRCKDFIIHTNNTKVLVAEMAKNSLVKIFDIASEEFIEGQEFQLPFSGTDITTKIEVEGFSDNWISYAVPQVFHGSKKVFLSSDLSLCFRPRFPVKKENEEVEYVLPLEKTKVVEYDKIVLSDDEMSIALLSDLYNNDAQTMQIEVVRKFNELREIVEDGKPLSKSVSVWRTVTCFELPKDEYFKLNEHRKAEYFEFTKLNDSYIGYLLGSDKFVDPARTFKIHSLSTNAVVYQKKLGHYDVPKLPCFDTLSSPRAISLSELLATIAFNGLKTNLTHASSMNWLEKESLIQKLSKLLSLVGNFKTRYKIYKAQGSLLYKEQAELRKN